MDIRQVLQGCCGTTMEQSDKQSVIDYVEGLKAQVATLKHAALELHGVISEFRNLPTKCLERRMFDTADRYFQRINSTPEQCLAAHDAELTAKAVLEFSAKLLVNQKVDVIDCAKVEADQLSAKAGA